MQPDSTSFPLLRVAVPTFRYNTTPALANIDLSVARPCLAALLGPNGSGKSTLLKIAAGLLRASRATVQIRGESVGSLSIREVARLLAWVPQRADLPFAVTVREMVRVGRYRIERPLRPAPPEEGSRIETALESVGLSGLADREVETLSGGEWQRALVARAIAQDTPVLLLDEPVANLDLRYQDEIYILLRRLADDGRLVVVADHHLEIAASYADRALLLHRGTIVADGPPASVLTAETIRDVFGVRLDVFADPVTGSPRLSRPKATR